MTKEKDFYGIKILSRKSLNDTYENELFVFASLRSFVSSYVCLLKLFPLIIRNNFPFVKQFLVDFRRFFRPCRNPFRGYGWLKYNYSRKKEPNEIRFFLYAIYCVARFLQFRSIAERLKTVSNGGATNPSTFPKTNTP